MLKGELITKLDSKLEGHDLEVDGLEQEMSQFQKTIYELRKENRDLQERIEKSTEEWNNRQ